MTEQDIRETLKTVKYPGFTRDIVSFGVVKEVALAADRLEVRLTMITDNTEVVQQIVADVEGALAALDGAPPAAVIVEKAERKPAADARQMAEALGRGPAGVPGVARLVAVASGKGGVGKSTVAANLATRLAADGYRVGLLDADIYGPSVPTMFGVGPADAQGADDEGRFVPIRRHGVGLISIGLFSPPGTPMIWRGPMLTKALGQFLNDVAWGELDYLILDLPPGTGDVQMTLTQNVRLDAGIIVTTPQDVALADVERGLKMFEQAETRVLGVVENMSFHVCSGCGHEAHIFGDGGGASVAGRFGVPLLGSIPLARPVREGGDLGSPVVVGAPETPAALALGELARRVAAELPVGQEAMDHV